MIDQSTVDDLFKAIGTAISTFFVRADQKLDKLDRPYGTYKIINEAVESLHQEIRTQVVSATPRSIDVSKWQASKAAISINFLGDTPLEMDNLRDLARKTLDYIRKTHFANYVVRILSPSIEDRTAFVEPDYNYQLGFDIRLDLSEEFVQTIEQMETVTMTPTVDGVQKADVTVTIN